MREEVSMTEPSINAADVNAYDLPGCQQKVVAWKGLKHSRSSHPWDKGGKASKEFLTPVGLCVALGRREEEEGAEARGNRKEEGIGRQVLGISYTTDLG